MTVTFVVTPQWQGSGSSRALRLAEGAEAIRSDLPGGATRTATVPAGAGETLGTGVRRYSALRAGREELSRTLAETPGTALVVGGDCGVEAAAVEHAVSTAEGETALVWFDAHADLHLPATSPSGAFHGMVLRALLGEGAEGLVSAKETSLPASRIVLAGTRALDPAERELIDERQIALLSPAELAAPAALVEAVARTGATGIYLHVDLDVLDPVHCTALTHPEPFGVALDHLVSAIVALRERFPLHGAGITEFAPASRTEADDALPVVLRVLGALTRPLPSATTPGTPSTPPSPRPPGAR